MRLFSWLRETGSPPGSRRARGRPAPRRRPSLEPLEDRCLLSAGGIDPTFGTGGGATTTKTVHGIAAAAAVYSDAQAATAGDVVAAGYIFQKRIFQFGLVRYTSGGKPDTTFGTKGEVYTAFDSYDYSEAVAVAIQGNGEIVAMGTAYNASSADFALVRYKVNGKLDSAFGTQGEVTTDFTGSSTTATGDYARAGFLQPDGKIVVAGITTTNYSSADDIALARYNANGSLDSKFGVGGKVVTSHTVIPGSLVGDLQVEAAASQADGSILVSGYVRNGSLSSYEAFVARYKPNGTLDASFGHGGVVTLPPQITYGPDGPAAEIAVEPNGEIVMTGFNQLALLHSDGSLDTSFGTGGIGPYGAGPVAVEPNGDIVTYSYAGNQVNRYLPNGAPDPTFGTGGTVLPPPLSFLNALAIQPDGKIVVADGYEVARLLPGEPQIGSFKATTNAGGSVTLTAAGVTALNPGSSVAHVSFYVDSNGDGLLDAGDLQLTGTVTQSGGTWTLTFSTTTAGLAPGNYTLFAQAQDSYGALSDPLSLSLLVT
jgi:uncharacterized delta-60 repeat protein